MPKRKYSEWLQELTELVQKHFQIGLDEMPEYDHGDARSYFQSGDAPSLYFKECLSEHCADGEKLSDMMRQL